MTSERQNLNDFLSNVQGKGHDEVVIRDPTADQQLMKVTEHALKLLTQVAQTENAHSVLEELRRSFNAAVGKGTMARIEMILNSER